MSFWLNWQNECKDNSPKGIDFSYSLKGNLILPFCDTKLLLYCISTQENSITNYTSMSGRTRPPHPSQHYLGFRSPGYLCQVGDFSKNNKTEKASSWKWSAISSFFSLLTVSAVASEGSELNKHLDATHSNKKCQEDVAKDKTTSRWRNLCLFWSGSPMFHRCCHLQTCQSVIVSRPVVFKWWFVLLGYFRWYSGSSAILFFINFN